MSSYKTCLLFFIFIKVLQQETIRIPYRIPYEILVFNGNVGQDTRIFLKNICIYIFQKIMVSCFTSIESKCFQDILVVSCLLLYNVKQRKRLKFQEGTFNHGFKILSKSLSFHLFLTNLSLLNFQNKLKYMAWFKFKKFCLDLSYDKPVEILLKTPM